MDVTAEAPPESSAESARSAVESGLVLLALQAQAADPRPDPHHPGWINRRVEQMELLDTRAVRWRVSIDFVVPAEAPTEVIGGEVFYLVPITSLPKEDLVAFDLRDECGKALWMPTARETNRRVAPAMVMLARRALGVQSLPGTLEDDLMRVVATPPRDHQKAVLPFAAAAARLDAEEKRQVLDSASALLYTAPLRDVRGRWRADRQWRRAQSALVAAMAVQEDIEQRLRGREPLDEQVRLAAYDLMRNVLFSNQLQELAVKYLVYVGVTGGPGSRRIIKHASESKVYFWHRESLWKRVTQSLGWRCWPFNVPIGGRGGSHHLEVAAPPGVDIVRITANPTDQLEQERLHPAERGPEIRTPGFSPHVHIRVPREAWYRYLATVELRTSRSGWLLSSLLIGIVIAVVMAVGRLKLTVLLETAHGTAPGEAGTAATLLLALLGVIASLLARPGEHPLAARLLRLVRILILIDVGVVLTATGDLLLHTSVHHPPTALWSVLAILAVAVAVMLTLSWLMPRQLPWNSE